jgi:preprotein translocase subunit YajC
MFNLGIFAEAAVTTTTTAPSTTSTATAPGAGGLMSLFSGNGMSSILLMLGIFVVFYLVLILPESRRRKKLQAEIQAMKIGDKVITSSGITGTIDFIGEKTVYIKSLDAKLEVAKEAIAAVVK